METRQNDHVIRDVTLQYFDQNFEEAEKLEIYSASLNWTRGVI